jgi:hypothetical protein
MADRTDEIAREIEVTRVELGSNLQELANKVKNMTDWRRRFRKNPAAFLGVALGGGFLLSVLAGGGYRRNC